MASTTVNLDMEDRDPNSLSKHLQVSWDEVIGEPEDARSPECAWKLSRKIFDLSRNCCYIFLSVLCAPLTACCLGCSFACQSFEQIWCTNPAMRMCKISLRSVKLVISFCVDAIIVPCAEGCGRCCSAIKVKSQNITDPLPEKRELLAI